MNVYLVREEWDNCEEYDCHMHMARILAICATREKAKEFIRDLVPELSFQVFEDEGETLTVTEEKLEESDKKGMPQREIFLKKDEYHEDWLKYYIDEMEVLE